MLVFSTAIVALGASIAKTVIVFKIYRGGIPADFKLADTQIFFMWVPKAGFATIAINLPTLVWLRQTKAHERILASVRSFLSLSSEAKKSSDSARRPPGDTADGSHATMTCGKRRRWPMADISAWYRSITSRMRVLCRQVGGTLVVTLPQGTESR